MKNLKSIIALFAAVLIITACSKDKDFFYDMDSTTTDQSVSGNHESEAIIVDGMGRVVHSSIDYAIKAQEVGELDIKSGSSGDILIDGIDKVADTAVDWDPNVSIDHARIHNPSTFHQY